MLKNCHFNTIQKQTKKKIVRRDQHENQPLGKSWNLTFAEMYIIRSLFRWCVRTTDWLNPSVVRVSSIYLHNYLKLTTKCPPEVGMWSLNIFFTGLYIVNTSDGQTILSLDITFISLGQNFKTISVLLLCYFAHKLHKVYLALFPRINSTIKLKEKQIHRLFILLLSNCLFNMFKKIKPWIKGKELS